MRWIAVSLTVAVLVAGSVSCGRGGSTRNVLQNKGSDTLVNVAQAWAEAYKSVNPDLAIAVTGGGSGTGISSLINGTVDVANSSRRITEREVELARRNGNEPVEFVVGFDALAVYVHADNPVESLTIEQLAEIYGEHGEISRWSQLGVEVAPGHDEIVVVSRQNSSGTYAYFKNAVLGKEREYRLGTLDQAGSKEVVGLVADTPGAIGFSGLAYATPHVRMVAVSVGGAPPVAPAIATALDGSYPIARPLLMYTLGEPQGAVKTYMDWVLGEDAQRILVEKGYAPAPSRD